MPTCRFPEKKIRSPGCASRRSRLTKVALKFLSARPSANSEKRPLRKSLSSNDPKSVRKIFSPTAENYSELIKTTPFFSYAVNSLIVTIGSAGLGLLFGIPAAFAVSWTRISWPAILTLAARMAPGTLFLLPWYVMFRQVGLIGSC